MQSIKLNILKHFWAGAAIIKPYEAFYDRNYKIIVFIPNMSQMTKFVNLIMWERKNFKTRILDWHPYQVYFICREGL